MKQAIRIIVAMAVGFVMTIAAVEVSDQVAAEAPGSRLGRLDFYRYCEKEWGKEYGPMNLTGAPLGWSCTSDPGAPTGSFSINLKAACETLYGAPAYADTESTANAFAWECYRGPQTRG